MTTLRIIALVCWLAVLVYMAPAVFSVLRGRPHNGDPARVVCFGYAFVAIGFLGRWLIAPDDTEVWAMLYIASAIMALFTLKTARSYGRGPRV